MSVRVYLCMPVRMDTFQGLKFRVLATEKPSILTIQMAIPLYMDICRNTKAKLPNGYILTNTKTKALNLIKCLKSLCCLSKKAIPLGLAVTVAVALGLIYISRSEIPNQKKLLILLCLASFLLILYALLFKSYVSINLPQKLL